MLQMMLFVYIPDIDNCYLGII